MAAPSGIVWGSVVGSGTKQAKLGIYVKLTTSNTQVVREVQVWYWTRYAVSDSTNTFYYDCSQTATSATTSKGSVSISHSSNSSWSTSNQTKLATYSSTYTRGTSAKTYKIYAKLTGIDYIGVAASANTSFTIPALASYTISYNANGGSGAPSNQTKYYGTTLTLSSTKPTKANATATYTVTLDANGGSCSTSSLTSTKTTTYTFSKWNTASDGSGTAYAAGASYTANAAATLYAIYTSSASTTAVTLPTPTRTGYTFKGWGTASTSTSGSTGSYTPTASVTLYAVWQINTYTVTFNGNGGTSSEASKTANYNTCILTLPTATKKNHNFVEWNTAADGSGTTFTNSTKVTADITVYAIYELAANCFVKNNGVYTAAMLYVMVDGIYKTGMLYVRDNGTYKQSGM